MWIYVVHYICLRTTSRLNMTSDSFHYFVEQERAIIGKGRFFENVYLKKNLDRNNVSPFFKKKLPKSKPNWTLSKVKIVMPPYKKPSYHNHRRRQHLRHHLVWTIIPPKIPWKRQLFHTWEKTPSIPTPPTTDSNFPHLPTWKLPLRPTIFPFWPQWPRPPLVILGLQPPHTEVIPIRPHPYLHPQTGTMS